MPRLGSDQMTNDAVGGARPLGSQGGVRFASERPVTSAEEARRWVMDLPGVKDALALQPKPQSSGSGVADTLAGVVSLGKMMLAGVLDPALPAVEPYLRKPGFS